MWYVTARGTQKGPVTEAQLISLIHAGDVVADDMVWKKGMAEWENVTIHFGNEFSSQGYGGAFGSAFGNTDQPPPMNGGYQSNPYSSPAPPNMPVSGYPHSSDPNRLAAALLAIFLGSFGIHKFYLGYKSAGVIMLLITLLTCGLGGLVMNVIGIIEGIIYIAKSEEDFYYTYVQYEKPWF